MTTITAAPRREGDRSGVYALTKLGWKVGGSFTPHNRNSILDFLRTVRSAEIDELAAVEGVSRAQVRPILAELKRRGYIREV